MPNSLARSYKIKNDRRFERLKATYLIKYWAMHEDQPNAIETANTKDISAGGVRFYTRQKLLKGSVLRVQILLPPLCAKVSAFAQVISVSSAWPRKMFYVSASFIEISQDDFVLLSDYVTERAASRESDTLFDFRQIAVRTPADETLDE